MQLHWQSAVPVYQNGAQRLQLLRVYEVGLCTLLAGDQLGPIEVIVITVITLEAVQQQAVKV